MKTYDGNVDTLEIGHFAKDAPRWWDPHGPFAPLHRLNPARLAYIKSQICRHYKLDEKDLKPFGRLSVLDIGCGGGLVSEPMARMGAQVTGIDADKVAIDVAQVHAAESGLKVRYENKTAEELYNTYDVVLALEIVEHVPDPAAFVKTCAYLAKPGGIVIFSTLNRTPKSFALGIVAAEYILRWVPRGTHSWRRFLRPSELAKKVRDAGLKAVDISGLVFNPIKSDFEISKKDIDVNYFMTALKEPAQSE